MEISNNVCVIGAGYWGKNHIRTLNGLNKLGAIVESNVEVLDRFSQEYPNVKMYTSLDEALLNQNLKGFTVATPAETHFEIARKIIKAKKHVLVEKPLTLDIAHAQELVNLAEENQVNLMVGHVLLFHPAIIKIKKLIKEGLIGRLQYIYSNRLNLGQVRTEENVFWSLAPHDISIFQYLTDDAFPTSIKAHGNTFLQEGIHDSTLTMLEYPNNVKGHIFVSWIHPFKEHRLVVIGSDGMLTFEDSAEGKPLKLYKKKYEIIEKIPEKIDGPVDLIEYDKSMPLTEELEYFTRHLNGDKLEIANGNHAVDVTKILVEASNQLSDQ